MKTSWKKMICSILVIAIVSSHVSVASAGLFTSAVKKAAGVAMSHGGSGASMMKKAAGVAMNQVAPNNGSLTSKILGKAKDIATNDPNSLAGKVLNKAKQAASDPNSLTGKVLTKAKTAAADPNSITSKIITKVNAAGADPNSLTNKVINRAKTSLSDPNSLTSKIITKANTAVNDPNSLTGKVIARANQSLNDQDSLTNKLINRAKNSIDDPNSLTNKVIARANQAVNDPNSLTNKLVNKAKDVVENGNLEQAIVDLQQVAEQAVDGNVEQDDADELVGQIVSAGIQAGGQILSSAIANGRPVMIPVSSFEGDYAPVSYSQGDSLSVEEEVAPVANFDLELNDLRFVDNGSDEQGPRYRVTVRNLSRSDVTSEITVALLASVEADGESVSTLGSLAGLNAGEMKTVDLRLPAGSQVLEFLTAAVALTDAMDSNENDNVATFDRDSVRDVALQFTSIKIVNDGLVLTGEGFGRDAGKLTLKVGSTNVPMNASTWSATEIGFKLPKVDFSKVQGGQLQVVRADGRTAQPLALSFAR